MSKCFKYNKPRAALLFKISPFRCDFVLPVETLKASHRWPLASLDFTDPKSIEEFSEREAIHLIWAARRCAESHQSPKGELVIQASDLA